MIIIRIKRRKVTGRRKLGKGDMKEKDTTEEPNEFENISEEATDEVEVIEIDEKVHIPVIKEPEKEIFVLPGDHIGTSEEFIAKNGTFVAKGNIYAAATGIVKINNRERSISVIPVTSTPPHLKVGDIVIGQVTDVKESVALVEIAGIKGMGEREIVNSEQAAIHVSNVKDAYVKGLYNEFSPNDIVKAKVIDLKSMRLTTANKELGVMKAYCNRCKTPLKLDDGKLKCSKCSRIETRKLSSDYGTGII